MPRQHARTFSIGQPHPEVARWIDRTLGALDVVTEHLKPGARCTDLLSALQAFCSPVWADRWWVVGYELGIIF